MDQNITEEDLTKNSILKPEQLKGFENEDECYAIVETGFVDDLKQAYNTDRLAKEVIEDQNNPLSKQRNKKWMVVGEFVVRKDNLEQIYVPQELRKTILQLYHDSEYSGHLGVKKTYDLITRYYYWPHIRKDISAYVRACNICSTQKDTTHAKYGRMVRVSLTELPWQEVEIDFITNLPLKNSSGASNGSNNPTEITNTTSGCKEFLKETDYK